MVRDMTVDPWIIVKRGESLNKYALIDENKKNNQKAEDLINQAIRDFIENMRRIKVQFPNVGIGDTETDESIIQEVYDQLHVL